MIRYHAVSFDGTFKSSNNIRDLRDKGDYDFLVRNEIRKICNTYDYYDSIIVDEFDEPTFINYHGFGLEFFQIKGEARNYILDIRFMRIGTDGYFHNNAYEHHVFNSDISFNHIGEDYKRTLPEWSLPTIYQDIFNYFDELLNFGDLGYEEVISLRRKLYATEAAYRQEVDTYSIFRDNVSKLRRCISEIIIPDEWHVITKGIIISDSIQRIVIPSSIEAIFGMPFECGDNLKQIFCYCEQPPKLYESNSGLAFSTSTALYVPEKSIDNYRNNKEWNNMFPIIKGF